MCDNNDRANWRNWLAGRLLFVAYAFILAVIIGGCNRADGATTLVDAIHMVESGGRTGPIRGDGGRALGPLQIHRACWIDSGIPGRYEDCADLAYSKRVFAAYVARYATERRLGRPVTDEDRARLWNGGPNAHKATGRKKANLDRYWAKVQKELNR